MFPANPNPWNLGYLRQNLHTWGLLLKPRFCLFEPVLNPYLTPITSVFYSCSPRIFVLVRKTTGFHEKHRVYVHTLQILRGKGFQGYNQKKFRNLTSDYAESCRQVLQHRCFSIVLWLLRLFQKRELPRTGCPRCRQNLQHAAAPERFGSQNC